MNSRNRTGNINPITTGAARAAEPFLLMAPRPVKALPEHAGIAQTAAPPAPVPASSAAPLRRMHSMGYGIDE